MRIVAYADLHGYLFECPPCDVLLLAGDIGPDHGRAWYADAFRPWVADLEAKGTSVVWVWGNHDHELHADWALARSLGGSCLHASGTALRGLRLWGSPYVPHCGPKPGPWGEHWQQVPDRLDILLNHGPPLGVADWSNGHMGCEALASRILASRPRLVVFGHNHGAHGWWHSGGTLYLNCTSGQHGPTKHHRPVVFDWPVAWPTEICDMVPGRYLYRRVGIGERHLRLLPLGQIDEGSAGCERLWKMGWGKDRSPRLIIAGDPEHGDVIRLRADGDSWVGRWIKYEKNNVVLERVPK